MKTTWTIPHSNQLIELFEVVEQGKKEGADARTMGKIQRAFERTLRFGKWSEDSITLRGIRYRDLYSTPWMEDFFLQKGYQVIPFEHEDMTDVQYARALKKHIKLKLIRQR